MQSIDLIRRLHQHRQWVNDRLLETASQLSKEQMHRRFEIGQGSIWLTLTHLYGAEYIWLESLLGNERPVAPGDAPNRLPGNQCGDDPFENFEDLAEHWGELAARWLAFLDSLTDDSLLDPVYKYNSLTGTRAGTTRCDVLLHLCTHAQYTVAQAINMMRHVGVTDLPDPMLITMARDEFSGESPSV